jgi:2'-5' RNA ligase
MQRFLHGLTFKVKSIVRHHQYHDMNDLLHLAHEAEAQLAEESQYNAHTTVARGRFSPRPVNSVPPPSPNSGFRGPTSNKPELSVSTAKKTVQPAASAIGSSMSTARN